MDSSFAVFNDQGQCSALLTREGFFDFTVLRTRCDVSHNVAVVCQHEQKVNTAFNNNLSDVKVSIAAGGFYRIEIFSSCDIGWFRVYNMCINFYHCSGCSIVEAHEQCVVQNGSLAHAILNNVTVITPENTLAKSTELSLFWYMFHHIDSIDLHGYDLQVVEDSAGFAVNGSGMCVILSTRNQCTDNIFLSISYHHIIDEEGTLLMFGDWGQELYWANPSMGVIIDEPYFQPASKSDFTLCEKSVLHTAVLPKCSDLYMVCDDGTCVHDSLVCDGKPHCQHGEDEADCQHICSDHSHRCMSHCHHRDLCSCSSEYFQCLSGGCVPLQKLCDKLIHCIDGSDEPETCVYLKPEKLGHTSVSLSLNNYTNN